MKPQSLKVIETFFNDYPTRQYKKGHILLLAGEATEHAYFISDGRIKVYDVTYRGDEIVIDSFREPSFFPVSLIINRVSTRYIYEAETDITIRQAPRQAVVDFLDAHPSVVYDLLGHLYVVIDEALARMVVTIGSSARTRLIYSLVAECRKFGKLQDDGSYLLEISERNLGARAGLTRETVSREAKMLKASKLIEVHHRYIIIRNLPRLERYIEEHLPR